MYICFFWMLWFENTQDFLVYTSCFLKICSVLFPLDSAGEYDDWSHIFTVNWWLTAFFVVDGAQVPLGFQFPFQSDISLKKFIDCGILGCVVGLNLLEFGFVAPSPGFRRSCRTVQADRRLVDTWAEAVGWWWCFVCFVVPKMYGCRRSHHFKFIPPKNRKPVKCSVKRPWLHWPSAYDRLQDAPRAAPRAERLLEEARTPWCTRWVCLLTRWILILSFFG